jgi:hypothetical protein
LAKNFGEKFWQNIFWDKIWRKMKTYPTTSEFTTTYIGTTSALW